jgi:uncharacterized membrane protein
LMIKPILYFLHERVWYNFLSIKKKKWFQLLIYNKN